MNVTSHHKSEQGPTVNLTSEAYAPALGEYTLQMGGLTVYMTADEMDALIYETTTARALYDERRTATAAVALYPAVV